MKMLKNEGDNTPRNIIIDAGFHTGSFSGGFLEKYKDFFCYAFEPNDLLLEKNKHVREKYKDRLIFSDKIIWVENIEMELSIGTKGMKGSSVLSKGNLSNKKVVKEAFDFSLWLKETVEEEDEVFVKMDIEGSEYYVLPKLINNGTINLIDKLIVEFHFHKMVESKKYKKIHDKIIKFLEDSNIELIEHTSWVDDVKRGVL